MLVIDAVPPPKQTVAVWVPPGIIEDGVGEGVELFAPRRITVGRSRFDRVVQADENVDGKLRQQRGAVAEVVRGGRVRHVRLAGDGAHGDALDAIAIEQFECRIDQHAAKIAVVVPTLHSSFPRRHIDTVHITRNNDVDTVNIEVAMSIRLIVLCLALLGGGAAASAQDRLTGTWLTADRSSHVAFAPCGANDCGRIVWLKEARDPQTGQPWQDKFNPDEALRRRALLGLTMASDLKSTGPRRWDGTLYNPLDGKTYTGTFEIVGSGEMQLKGCAFAGLLCETETWTAVAP